MPCRYNAFQRSAELELVPVLRAYGIRYYVYNPLAAGMLVGKYRAESIPEGSRFTDTGRQGAQYKGRYFHDEAFAAIATVGRAGATASPPLTMLECAIRWTAHHSALDAGLGDRIIIGVSSLEQLEQNMDARGGPLVERATSCERLFASDDDTLSRKRFGSSSLQFIIPNKKKCLKGELGKSERVAHRGGGCPLPQQPFDLWGDETWGCQRPENPPEADLRAL